MVQILPQAPSLGELLGGGVSTGLQTVLQQKMQMNKLRNILSMGAPNQGNGSQQADLSQTLSGQEGQSQQEMQPQAQQQFQLPHSPQKIMGAEVLGEHGLASAWQHDNDMAMKQHELNRKESLAREKFQFEKEKEERKRGIITPETKTRLSDVFKRQDELLKSGNVGMRKTISSQFSEQGRQDRAEFDTLSASIEAALMPLVSKGTLAKDRFKYIMSLLPKATDTIGGIKGKIKALKRELQVIDQESPQQSENLTENTEKKELQIGQTATNPKTGVKIEWTGSNWRKAK